MLPLIGVGTSSRTAQTASRSSPRQHYNHDEPIAARVMLDPHFTLPLVPRPFGPPTQQWGNEVVHAEGLQSALLRKATTPYSKDSRFAPPTHCPMCRRVHRGLTVDAAAQAAPVTNRRAVQVDGEADGLPPPVPLMHDFGQTFDSAVNSLDLVVTATPTTAPFYSGDVGESKMTVAPPPMVQPIIDKAVAMMTAVQSHVPALSEPVFQGQYMVARADRGHSSALGRLQQLAAAMITGIHVTAAMAIDLHVAVTSVIEQVEKERKALSEAVALFADDWRAFTWDKVESTKASFLSHYYSLAKDNDELRDQRHRMTLLMTPQHGLSENEVKGLVDAALTERYAALRARRNDAGTQCPDRESIVLKDTRRRSTITATSGSPSRGGTTTGSPRNLVATDSMVLRTGNKSPEMLMSASAAIADRVPTVMFETSTTNPGEFLLQAVGPAATDVELRDALASLLTRDRDIVQLLRTTTPGGAPVQSMASHASLFPTAPVIQAIPSRLLKPTTVAREPSRLDDTFVISTDPKPPPKKYVAPAPSPMTARFYAGTYPDSPRFTESQQAHLAASRHPKPAGTARPVRGRAGLS